MLNTNYMYCFIFSHKELNLAWTFVTTRHGMSSPFFTFVEEFHFAAIDSEIDQIHLNQKTNLNKRFRIKFFRSPKSLTKLNLFLGQEWGT